MIQSGGVCTTFCQREGILLQKYRDRNGRCIAILFKNVGVRGRCDSPDRRCYKVASYARNCPVTQLKELSSGAFSGAQKSCKQERSSPGLAVNLGPR